MKKFLYFAAFAMMIVLSSVIVSCGDDEVPEEAYETTIVGTWFTDGQVAYQEAVIIMNTCSLGPMALILM